LKIKSDNLYVAKQGSRKESKNEEMKK